VNRVKRKIFAEVIAYSHIPRSRGISAALPGSDGGFWKIVANQMLGITFSPAG
jgi:hypothetical protein